MEVVDLGARVEALERANGTLRRSVAVCVVAVLALAAAGVSGGEEGSAVVRGQRFELVNKKGEVVGTFGTELGYYPYLEVQQSGSQGAGGKARLELPSGSGPALSLMDSGGIERVRLYLGGRLTSTEVDGKAVRYVGDQIPHLQLFDDQHQIRGTFGTSQEGAVKVELRDKAGKIRFLQSE